MEFEWDSSKNEANIQKHGIDFEDVLSVFESPLLKRRSDRKGEKRWMVTGDMEGRLVTVVYTMRGERYRLISARRASRNERREYRQEIVE